MLRNADASEGTIVDTNSITETTNPPSLDKPVAGLPPVAKVMPRNFFVSADERTRMSLKQYAQALIKAVTDS